jgi:hypothetical protein
MALVWAHAEHIKLCRSLPDDRFFDQPPQAMERCIFEKTDSPYAIWSFNHKCRTLPAGKTLRPEVLSPTVVHGRMNNWPTVHNTETRGTGLGVSMSRTYQRTTCLIVRLQRRVVIDCLHLLRVQGVHLDNFDLFMRKRMDKGFGIGAGRFVANLFLVGINSRRKGGYPYSSFRSILN